MTIQWQGSAPAPGPVAGAVASHLWWKPRQHTIQWLRARHRRPNTEGTWSRSPALAQSVGAFSCCLPSNSIRNGRVCSHSM